MKKILIVATGGTIASMPQEDGLAPELSGQDLIQRVPELKGLCDITTVQPMNIDSTNMRPRDWLTIASVIAERYDEFDGFVILHGTDTMAYSAAALSYLLQDSPKPIVLTGSQQPMAAPFTDAQLNVYQSIIFALNPCSFDVNVVFGSQVIAGTRAHKQRTMSFNAFSSMNYPVLAYIRGDKVVWFGLMEPDPAARTRRALKRYTKLDERVIVLKLTPELKPSILGLLKDDYDAVILETFGVGGIPDYNHHAFRRAIFEWTDSGKTVVLTTQVPEEGLNLGVYEVGHAFAHHPGILQGEDMTTEAIVAKTMWALGQSRERKAIEGLFSQVINHDHTPTS